MPSKIAAAPDGGAFLYEKPNHIFTPEDFDADSLLMIETAKHFARREVQPMLDRLDQQEPGLMEKLFADMGALGLAGIETPEKYGGLGLSKALGTRILEMLSLNGSFSTTAAVHVGIGQAPIYLWGTPEQKARYLPKLASGEWMGAYALSEPNSGSDALAMSTKAVREGEEYVLTGTKMWISNAKWAKLFIVFARMEDGSITAFIVERDFPGVSIGAEEHKTGLKGSSTARLVLDDARIPAANVLYRVGEGHRVALNALNLGRLKLGAMSLGPARSALHFAARYAKERKQFGQSIAEFGLIADKFARMAALFYGAESALYRTCALLDDAFGSVDSESPDENRLAAEKYAIECSICKVFSTEVLAVCADEAIQIHGGYGFTEEFPVARIWRDARVTRIYEGTNEVNRLFIWGRIMKKGFAECLLHLESAGFTHHLLVDAANAAMETYGDGLDREQQIVGALSDLVIAHYTQQSADLRAAQAGSAFAKAAAVEYRNLSESFAIGRAAEVFARCGIKRELTLPPQDFDCAAAVSGAVLEASGYPIG